MERAFNVLKELPIGGFTYYESKGRGQIPTPVMHTGRGTSVFRPEFNFNVEVDAVVPDSLSDEVEHKILESTSTVLASEGKIFVSHVVYIGTGNKGDEAT